MPLYNFTANNYGENWFVSAATREDAISAVKRAIHANWQRQMAFATEEEQKYGKSERRDRETRHRNDSMRFLQCCIDGKAQCAGGTPCSVDEIPDGTVIFSEVA
jgi:hypothetical protein